MHVSSGCCRTWKWVNVLSKQNAHGNNVQSGLGSECRYSCSKIHRPATLRVWEIRRFMHLAAFCQHKPALGRSGNLAGVEGFEPANAGIKIQCLNQLGDTPTQDSCCCQQPTYNRCLLIASQKAGSLPTCQRMHLQIFAFSSQPVARDVCQVGIVKNLCKYSTSRAGHAS